MASKYIVVHLYHQRENTISELQSRNKLLEEQIAKQLQVIPQFSWLRWLTILGPIYGDRSFPCQLYRCSQCKRRGTLVRGPGDHYCTYSIQATAAPPALPTDRHLVRAATGHTAPTGALFAEIGGPPSDGRDIVLPSSSPVHSSQDVPMKNAKKRPAPAQTAKGTENQPAKRAVCCSMTSLADGADR